MKIDELASATGLPLTTLRQWERDAIMPVSLRVQEGKHFVYAPVALAFCEAVTYFRGIFGTNSAIPVQLAKAGLANIERLWHSGVPEGARLRIYAEDMIVELDPDFIEIAKKKLSAVAA